MKRKMRLIILVTMGLAAGAQSGAAGTWYVAPSGSDSADGTNWVTALLTISNALGKAVSNDTILVSNGTYTLSTQLVLTNRVTLRSWKDGAFDPLGTVINGNAADRCLFVSNVNALVAGLTFSNGLWVGPGTSYQQGGGGVYLRGGTVSNCLITGNVATNGGGMYIHTAGTLRNSTLSGNTAKAPATDATYQGGGGIILYAGGTVLDCLISNNVIDIGNTIKVFSSAALGGGVLFWAGGLLTNCVIVNNVNTGSFGGAVFFRSGGILKNSTLADNSARGGGGAFVEQNAGQVLNCLIERNLAIREGGGARVYAGLANVVYLRNCLIRYNTARGVGTVPNGQIGGGGGVAMDGGPQAAYVESCTIVSNHANTRGGGLYAYCNATRTNHVYNTISYFNTADAGGSNWDHNLAGGATMVYSNMCTAPDVSSWGAGNITGDPKLKDIEGGNFKLSPYSPCIDAGLKLNWMTNTVDLDGTKRIVNDRVDIGAYEFFPAGAIIRIR